MIPEDARMHPDLEEAVAGIRDDAVDPAVVEAAAARVWQRLAEARDAAGAEHNAEHIRDCAGFQALFPDYRAGRLSDARALLVKDHLRECVACRRVFEGKVVAFPTPQAKGRVWSIPVRWAAAAAVVVAAGVTAWVGLNRMSTGPGRNTVESLNGSLYAISEAGIRPLAPGQDVPEGVAVRTAKDSYAVLRLRDGSSVEMRERSDFSTSQSGRDTLVRLDRGSVIVRAAKRRTGHLYVNTADCRVAVTGTVFSVNAGIKGSRISVIQGEVRVAQDNREKVLHPGDQTVTRASLEPIPVRDEVAWSRNVERLVPNAAAAAPPSENPLLERAPASTVFFLAVSKPARFLEEMQRTMSREMAETPEFKGLAGQQPAIDGVLAKMRGATAYLGGEVAVLGFTGPDGKMHAPLFLAEDARPGLVEYLSKGSPHPLASVARPGLVVFSPDKAALDALTPTLNDAPGAFRQSSCYSRIAEAERNGATVVTCADLKPQTPGSARYFLAEQKEGGRQPESRATIGFDGPRTGIAAWLAPPAPMGSLDYVSPQASAAAAFVVKSPAAIVDEIMGLQSRSQATEEALAEARAQTGIDLRNDLAAPLGGEFALALDGPAFPVPSWKLIVEVYDPARFQASLEKLVTAYNTQTVRNGGKPLRTGRETVNGRVYYMLAAADPNPLTEVHYGFSDGYLIAGPSRAIVNNAVQVKAAGNSITRSPQFVAMTPRDHYANFSALIYQNLGSTLAPLSGLLGMLGQNMGGGGRAPQLPDLNNIQPSFVAAYGEPDRITIATVGNSLGIGPDTLMRGSLAGLAGSLPFGQLGGTRPRPPAFR